MSLVRRQNEPINTYWLQIVLQTVISNDSPVYLYDETFRLQPVTDFYLTVKQIVDKRRENVEKVKHSVSGHVIDQSVVHAPLKGNRSVESNQNKSALFYVKDMLQQRIRVKNKNFVLLTLETTKVSSLNIKFAVTSISGNKKNENNVDEEYYAIFIGTQFSTLQDLNTKNYLVTTLIDKELNVVGELRVEYFLIKSYKNNQMFKASFESFDIRGLKKKPVLIGHRGAGTTYGKTKSNYMENSINSFKAAYSHGADFVELDVQLTKDEEIVVYHDFDANAIIQPIKKKKQTPNNLTIPIKKDGLEPCYDSVDYSDYTDDNSDDASSKSSISVSIRNLSISQLKSNKFYNSKHDLLHPSSNNHASSEGEVVPQGNMFPSLSEVLNELPNDLGVNIEVKSIQQKVNNSWESEVGVLSDRNILVDRVLDAIFEGNYAQRNIFFSSFDPWLCSILKKKQDRYPVLFLIEPKSEAFEGYKDGRTSSIDSAIAFAEAEQLAGIVCCSDYIMDSIHNVASYAHNKNLVFYTYGEKNNHYDDVITQIKGNVDGIISDSLRTLIPELKKNKQI